MNNIDEMPAKCKACPYWEACEYPGICQDTEPSRESGTEITRCSDDTISRRAALDALNEQVEQCNKALGSFDISLKDEFAIKVERASLKAYKEQLENLPPVQLGTNLAEVGTDLVSKRAAIDALATYIYNVYKVVVGKTLPAEDCGDAAESVLDELPTVQDEKLEKCRFEYINACRIVTNPTPDTTKKDISDAYAVIKVLQPIFDDVTF